MKIPFQRTLIKLAKKAFRVYWYAWGVWVFTLLKYTGVNALFYRLFYRWVEKPSLAWGILYDLLAFPFVLLYFLPFILGVCYAVR